MKNSQVGVFRKIQQPRLMSITEMITAQNHHDAHKDEDGHECDLCPVKMVIPAEEIRRVLDDLEFDKYYV